MDDKKRDLIPVAAIALFLVIIIALCAVRLRSRENGFVDDVFTLLVGALACAIARTLKKPESFALERARLCGRVEIIKNGSAAVPEGGHRK